MKISKVYIEKFRSIFKASFIVSNVAAIVGQNNSGKSAILKALNSFFNPDQELISYENGTHLYTNRRSVPRIEITFAGVPPGNEYVQYLTNAYITIRQSYHKKTRSLIYEIKHQRAYYPAPQSLIATIRKGVNFILIPTDRSIKSNSTTERSILRKLLVSFFEKHTSNRDTLTPKVKEAYEYFEDKAVKKITQEINGKYGIDKGFEVQLETSLPISYKLFLNSLNVTVKEEEKLFSLEECGSGVQSLVIMAIYRILSELDHSNVVIGVEEPEMNLHPQAQRELILNLLGHAQAGSLQLFLTTHSTVIVDQLSHEEIILVRKKEDPTRGFRSDIFQIPINFWTRHNLTDLQYYKFYKYKNSDFFFANHVIVVESSIDSEVFKRLFENRNIRLDRSGISILNLDGIKSLKYPFYLFKYLEIPATYVVDKDFFFNYFNNNNKAISRYGNGFFKYERTFKVGNSIVQDMINSLQDRNQIQSLLHTNHSRALEYLGFYNIVCMKFNLEMDLVSSRNAQGLFYAQLNIAGANQNTNHLLTNFDGALKRLDILLHVIDNLPHRNLPNSYKKLIRIIKDQCNP